MQSASAQDAKTSEDGAPYLGASEVAFKNIRAVAGRHARSLVSDRAEHPT